MTHYDVLGVAVSAGRDEIRAAYLERARELHPDRAGGDPARARRMQEVNEAWRVLGHAARRASYDAVLRARTAGASPLAGTADDDLDRPFFHAPAEPGDLGVAIVRALPWLAIAVVLVGIFVFTAFADREPSQESPRELLGHCLAPANSPEVTVPCDEPNEGEAVLIVDRSSACPSGTAARPVAGSRWLCVRPPGTGAGSQ